MLDRLFPTPHTSLPSHRSTLAKYSQNAFLCFQSITHSFQFATPSISRTFCALRTLCQKHPGVGAAQISKIADPALRALNPIESHCFTMHPCNHFRITLFHRPPRGWGSAHFSSILHSPFRSC